MQTDRSQLQRTAPGSYQLRGKLGFSTALDLHHQTGFMDAEHSEIRMDLAEVEAVDSAGVALLVHWIEYAERRGARIIWDNMPEQLAKLIRINGVDRMFQGE